MRERSQQSQSTTQFQKVPSHNAITYQLTQTPANNVTYQLGMNTGRTDPTTNHSHPNNFAHQQGQG